MPDHSSGRSLYWLMLAISGFVGIIHVAWWMIGDTIVAGGGLADGDSFTRLIRVERLIETGDWLDVAIPDANAPYGTSVHWTRLFDLILLWLALPLIPVLGFAKALFWAGVMVSPILHMIFAAALIWALRPSLGTAGALMAGVLTATQFGVLAFAIVGRADHHMMFAVIAALTLGFLIRALADADGGTRHAFWAGISMAAGLWVGPEYLLFMIICLSTAGLPWLVGELGGSARNQFLSLGLTVGLTLVLLAERTPADFASVEYDRVSVVHLTLGLTIWVFWQIAARLEGRLGGLASRAAAAGFGVLTIGLILWLLYPGVLGNPLTDVDPALLPIYAHISEYGAVTDAAQFLIYFGGLLFALPWMIWRFPAHWRGSHRWFWVLIAVALIVYSTFGLSWIRWSLYAALILAVVLADLAFFADRTIDARFRFPSRVPIKVVVLMGIAVGPLMVAGTIRLAEKTPAERAAAAIDPCPIGALSSFLNTGPWAARQLTIAASANFGPEIIYRTDHKVLATVHHRNAAGILDGYRLVNGSDPAESLKIARQRRIDLIVLCPKSGSDSYFLSGAKPGNVYERLETGDAPVWLRAVALPDHLRDKFRLFEVGLAN